MRKNASMHHFSELAAAISCGKRQLIAPKLGDTVIF